GWIKVHIAVDVKTHKLLALEITDERVGDNAAARKLIEQADKNVKNIKKVLGDGAYDTRELFNFLKRKNIEAGIRIRKNASTRSRGSSYRAKCVRERKKLGEEKWKEKYKYGKRWSAESYFSAEKRIFGEHVTATSWEGMKKEVKMKFMLYNMLLRTAR
ncbi:MAG: IS5 family transposase, partial [Methanomicrobia archaeon]|nr:IS5 family transposase [Methanomicrobia archaeon]